MTEPPRSDVTLTPSGRALSALELLVGAAIVLGHNVWRVVPNEVLILPLLGVLSMRLRSAGWNWATLGLDRPPSWRTVLLVALAAAALRILLSDYALDPLLQQIWPPAKSPEIADGIPGNLVNALVAFGLVWTFAAFGEEVAYRGYLLNRAAAALGNSTAAFWIAALIAATLFGYGHYYKGPAGVVDSGIAGLILGAAYLLSGRSLWTCIIAHGLIDTFGIVTLYFGWSH
jgi:membrane protease YdiL (CAAX protease family)